MSNLIFSEKVTKKYFKVGSAVVVISALMLNAVVCGSVAVVYLMLSVGRWPSCHNSTL